MNNRSAQDLRYVEDYLELNSIKDYERYTACLETMSLYCAPWWLELKGNPVELANCQIDQPTLLIPWKVFTEGVEKVIGRKLAEKELSSANTTLIAEFHKKYAEKYGKN